MSYCNRCISLCKINSSSLLESTSNYLGLKLGVGAIEIKFGFKHPLGSNYATARGKIDKLLDVIMLYG